MADSFLQNALYLLKPKAKIMSNKTRNIIKVVALVIVGVCLLMELNIVNIPSLHPHKFWLMTIAFAMVLISSK